MDEWDVVPPLALSSSLLVAANTNNVVASQPVRVGYVSANFGQRYLVSAHDVVAVPSDHLGVLGMSAPSPDKPQQSQVLAQGSHDTAYCPQHADYHWGTHIVSDAVLSSFLSGQPNTGVRMHVDVGMPGFKVATTTSAPTS